MGSRITAPLIAFVALLVVVGTAEAQDDEAERQEARAQFQRGVERFQAEDWTGALEAFQEAYRLRPHPSVRVNMANCYERLGRPMEAIFHYERYLAETQNGGGARPEQRREVQLAMERLRMHVGEVTLRIAPDGAMVRIDDAETRRAPITERLRLAAGTHTIQVSLEGFQAETRQLVVEGGQRSEVAVSLRRAAVAVVAPPVPVVPAGTETGAGAGTETGTGAGTETGTGTGTETEAEAEAEAGAEAEAEAEAGLEAGGAELSAPDDAVGDEGGAGLSTPVLISGAATGVLLLGTVITGILALGAQSDFDQAVVDSNDPELSADERADARVRGLDASDRAGTLATVSDVMLVGTLVGAGVTAYLFVSGTGSSTESAGASRRRVHAAVGPGGALLTVSGDF